MGLIDAFLRENLLARPIMQQNYVIELRGDTPSGATTPLGSGTLEDPWDGSTQPWFDWAMNQVPANSTVILGPAQFDDSTGDLIKAFETNGCAGAGFPEKPAQRIIGRGCGPR